MRHIIGSVATLATIAALAAVTGCASSSAHARTSDVVTAMNKELAHTVDQGGEAVGTTTVTSAPVEMKPAAEAEPEAAPAPAMVPRSGN